MPASAAGRESFVNFFISSHVKVVTLPLESAGRCCEMEILFLLFDREEEEEEEREEEEGEGEGEGESEKREGSSKKSSSNSGTGASMCVTGYFL